MKTYGVALIANGLNPLRLLNSAMSGAVLDELRNGPLDKHGAGSRILDVTAQVHEDEIERLATFGKECKDPAGGTERGLTAKEIETFMAANLKRAGDRARWYYPMLMKGEWPVLLNIMGKGEGERTLSQRRRGQDAVRRAALPRPHRRAPAARAVVDSRGFCSDAFS